MAETRAKLAQVDPVWSRIRSEAEDGVGQEPLLGGLLHQTILHHPTLEQALAYRMAQKLASGEMSEQILREIADKAYDEDPDLGVAARADVVAVYERDPACHRFLQPILYFKGFQAVQAYREMRHLNRREPIYHAYQLMSHPVSTVPIEMGILTAQHYFRDQGFQQMPVVNAQRRVVGMLSVENLLQFMIIDGDEVRHVRGKTVRDAMSQEVITADPVSDIRRIAQVMQEYHLDGVPIVDEQDALIGIVSRNDILRAVINDPPLTMWS